MAGKPRRMCFLRRALLPAIVLSTFFIACNGDDEAPAPERSVPQLAQQARDADPLTSNEALMALARNRDGLKPLLEIAADPAIGDKAVAALRIAGVPSAAEIDLVGDPSLSIEARAVLIRLIGEAGHVDTAPSFLRIALDSYEEEALRDASIRAIGTLHYSEAAVDLTPLLLDSRFTHSVSEALSALGEPSFEPVAAIATNRKLAISDRTIAVSVLARLGEVSVPVLEKIAREAPPESWDEEEGLNIDGSLQYATIQALGEIGPPALSCLLRLLREADEMTIGDVSRAIAATKDPRGVDPLLREARIFDSYSLDEITDALAEYGSSITPRLIDELSSREVEGRATAALTLGKIGGEKEIDGLLGAFSRERDPWARKSIAASLGLSKDPRAADALVARARAKDLAIVAGAYPFFMSRGEPDFEDLLVKALWKEGDSEMATAFLNSSNPVLSNTAREWADENGYVIEQVPWVPSRSMAPSRRW